MTPLCALFFFLRLLDFPFASALHAGNEKDQKLWPLRAAQNADVSLQPPGTNILEAFHSSPYNEVNILCSVALASLEFSRFSGCSIHVIYWIPSDQRQNASVAQRVLPLAQGLHSRFDQSFFRFQLISFAFYFWSPRVHVCQQQRCQFWFLQHFENGKFVFWVSRT